MYAVKKGKAGDIKKSIPDAKFKTSVLESLKAVGIDAKIDDLDSIVGPEEFSRLIEKYGHDDFKRCAQSIDLKRFPTETDYSAYMKTSGKALAPKSQGLYWETLPPKELEEYYRPLLSGDFRLSLHTHSNHSDGAATVQEFLDSANNYACKVAERGIDDGRAPFMVALTDHDNIDGCQEAFKIIAQNPQKYRNLKFVAGCEFSVKGSLQNAAGQYYDTHFDLTGLALNPFDEKLIKTLGDLKDARERTIREFLRALDPVNGTKYTLEDLIKAQEGGTFKEGKSTLKNRGGIVYVRHAIGCLEDIVRKSTGNETFTFAQKDALGDKDILPIDTVIRAVNENGGFTSLTHPIKSFWRYIGDKNLTMLKNKGVKGIEAYHQYTPSKYYKLKRQNPHSSLNANELFDEILKQYETFARKNDMFISGGTDSHKRQIFSRNPEITNELLAKILG